MARSVLDPHANDIIRKYSNGVTAGKLAKEYGCTVTTVTNLLKKAGVRPHLGRGELDEFVKADEARVVAMFRAGERPSVILDSLERSRSKSWLYQCLHRNGCDLRGLGDWRPSEETTLKVALMRQEGGAMNRAEQCVYDMLVNAGFIPEPQIALGTKNIDFLIRSHAVAVEVCGRGTFYKYIRDGWMAERIRNCAKAGWHTYVLAGVDVSDFSKMGIEDLCAWLDFMKRQPAARRQYRMIRGSSELLATGCSDDNHFSFIPAAE